MPFSKLTKIAESIGYYTWDIPENLVWLDSVSARLFDFDADYVAEGIPVEIVLEKIDEVTRRRIAKAIYDALVTREFYDQEYPVQHRDGKLCWLKVVGRVVAGADNEPLRAIGTIQDITRRRAMLIARRSRERLDVDN